MSDLPDRRLLLVHAHPDDESIGNGATMARYAAEGAHVTLVTCTLGEEGEVVPPGLAHLAPGRDDALGPYRAGELAAAMRELGVSDHRFLGGAGRYRDSGMMGTPQNEREGCLWRTRPDDAAPDLVSVVREVRPQVVVTYDPDGGYGHPDHIRAHQIAMRAVELAADGAYRPELGAPHEVARTYWNCVPRSFAEAGLARLREHEGYAPFAGTAALEALPGVVGDDEPDVAVDGTAYAGRKAAAMRAHATQITVHGAYFALSDGMGQPLHEVEFYRLARGRGAPAAGGDAVRPGGDLFEGLGV